MQLTLFPFTSFGPSQLGIGHNGNSSGECDEAEDLMQLISRVSLETLVRVDALQKVQSCSTQPS